MLELASQAVARYLPFELVEKYGATVRPHSLGVPTPIPENLVIRIAFWSFPDSEDDIRYVELIRQIFQHAILGNFKIIYLLDSYLYVHT